MNAGQLLSQIPGLTYRQLDRWTSTGYLRAAQAGEGAGHARDYSAEEVRVAALMVRLHGAGLNVASSHRAARDLAAGRPAVLAPGVEVVVQDQAVAAEPHEDASGGPLSAA
ncbi:MULTISPECIES: MerR family transcriptional regulator [unclassified Actinomadura]|uniref:MerR family transcriptional regulator n=1 Tax=unclassified Actinomadura TaxID=2626254 RepID=UPI00135AA38E|nr:MerR family transcriptional regulator [Actinomadura sp. K4S16]